MQQLGFSPVHGMECMIFRSSWVRESGSTKYARSRLYANDKEIVMAVVDASHAGQDLQGRNRVILRLTKGDAVKVMALGNGWHIEGDTHRTTIFTGVYLFD